MISATSNSCTNIIIFTILAESLSSPDLAVQINNGEIYGPRGGESKI
jgi:hypothetical protein